MFYTGSRYEKLERYTVTMLDGRIVSVTKLPTPLSTALVGYHARREGQRLDHIAYRYLKDATMFWRLCNANGAVVPDSLGVRELIGIPPKD